tara:strand:+ start:3007 stop:3258 length:252 start_codon:yes stop_codon:yes gene_type:complete
MTKMPFVLSLSKDSLRAHRSYFDKLSTNGAPVFFPPCAKHGEVDREAVEGPRAILTALGPSVTRLRQGFGARHLPKAALQGGY